MRLQFAGTPKHATPHHDKHDIPVGLRLKEPRMESNGCGLDRFLDAKREGCFVPKWGEKGGESAPRDRTKSHSTKFAWIGMVLWTRIWSRGIVTKLLEKTIEHLDQRKMPTMKLDATRRQTAL